MTVTSVLVVAMFTVTGPAGAVLIDSRRRSATWRPPRAPVRAGAAGLSVKPGWSSSPMLNSASVIVRAAAVS